MKKLLFVVSIPLVFISLLFSAVSSKAQSCNNTDDFESATLGATSFTSGGYTFNIISHVSTFNISNDDNQTGFGWNGTSVDNLFIDNNDADIAHPLPNASFSIKSTSGPFSVSNFWIYPDSSGIESLTGSVTFTGKLAGVTVFTVTVDSTSFNTNAAVNNGYTYIDFSTAALGNNIYQTIDELELTAGGSCNYIGIDEFKWVAGGAIPNPTTLAASSIASGGATLNGSVNADNLSTTNMFSYSSTSSTLSSGVTNVAASSATGGSSTSLSAAITGLSSSTTYYYRVSSTNCGATSLGSILSFTTAADYYSASSGSLDALATWSTNTNGTGGSHPSSFTAGLHTFHIANNNPGSITGSNWTVSGTNSKVVLDQGTDLTISSTKPVNATIDVSAGRQLTISNSTLPTLGVLSNTSTIDYLNLSNPTLLSSEYPNVIFDGTTINLSGAQTVNIGGNLTVQNNAVVSGAGNISMIGTAAQTITGTGSISNLQINDAAGISIASGTVNLTGTLTMTAGTLTTNGNLTLASSASGTARIAAIAGGSINGNVKVQQYIAGGKRSFRFLGHPFSTSIPLSQLETNLDVTGTGGSANGFTNTTTNNPSAFWYNPVTGDGSATDDVTGWIAFTSTNGSGANAWNAKEGVRLLVRGAQGQGLDGNSYTPNAVTFSMNGPVNQGGLTETMVLGANSGYNLLSNPYPSPTNIGTVIHNAAANVSGSAFWVWNATMQTAGAYVPVAISTTPYYLEANASFVVNTNTNNSTLTFAESNKNATASTSLFRTTSDMTNGVTLHLYDNTMNSWDYLYISFNNNAADSQENNDASKMHNSALDFYSFSSNNRKLCIDARPYAAGQVIQLGIATDVQQAYIIKAEDFTLPAGTEVYLHDKYLDQYQEIQNGSEYKFAVTADAASQGDNRFELSMAGNTTGIANVNSNSLKMSMVPNPATGQVTINYEVPGNKETSVRIMSMTGQEIITMQLGNQQHGSVNMPLQNVAAGMYMVELTSGNQTVTQKLIKQ